MQLLSRLSIWLSAGWLLAGASPSAARTELDLISASDAAELDANGALSTRLDLASTPELNISLTGGWSAVDPSSWDETQQLFLRGDARVELAGGRWLQTLYAGYTDTRREKRAGIEAGRFDVAQLHGDTRLRIGTLQELRLSSSHSLTLGLETRHDTLDAREQLHFGFRGGSPLDVSWTHTETRSHAALVESRVQRGAARFELGAAFEQPSGETGRLLARGAGTYVSRSGIQVLAAVGLGLADPARLASSLVPAGASSAPLVQTAGATRTLPRSWQLRATRGFASGKLTLGAALSQAHAQGPLDRLGDLAAQLELASASPLLQTRAERLEPFLAFTPHATARLELAYTLTAARLRDDEIRTLGGDDELAVHRQAARASLTWTPRPDSSFAFTLRYVGPRHDPATSVALASRIGSTQGSYGSCSVAFRHAFGARWRAFGQVESVVHRDRPTGATAAPPRVRGTIGAEATF